MMIDLTQTLTDNLQVYPGDESPLLVKQKDYSMDGFTDYRLATGMHTGTHIDGPMHLTPADAYISSIPLTSFIGTGCLLDVEGERTIKWSASFDGIVHGCSIVLVHTGFGRFFGTGKYFEDNPVFDTSFAGAMIERGVKMLGIDLASPDTPPHRVHKLLLSHNVLIAENLANLDILNRLKKFEVIALPLKINSDSSPARIIARETA